MESFQRIDKKPGTKWKKIAARISQKEGKREVKKNTELLCKEFCCFMFSPIFFSLLFSTLSIERANERVFARSSYLASSHVNLFSPVTHKCLLLWNSLTSFAYENIYQKYSSCLTLIDNNNREWKNNDGYFTNNNNVRCTSNNEKKSLMFWYWTNIIYKFSILFFSFFTVWKCEIYII